MSNWDKTCYVPKAYKFSGKTISMLTDLKVSSWACKGVFYRPECNAKGETHVIEFGRSWNAEMKYTMDRAQRADEKNEVICLFTMFTPRVMVIKMPKIDRFCIFCWQSCYFLLSVTVWAN